MFESLTNGDGIAAAVIDALSSQICVVDHNGTILAVNSAWRRFGEENSAGAYKSNIGLNYLGVCKGSAGTGAEEANDFAVGVRAVLEGKTDLFQLEYPCHSPHERRWFSGRVTPLQFADGGAVISHLNITIRKLLELELASLAATDSLTGLPNRRYFLESAERERELFRRFGNLASFLMIDIDNFKVVNDTYGHAAGDKVLRTIAQTCLLTHTGVFARWGGEEFVAMLPGIDEAGAVEFAESLRRAVSGVLVKAGRVTLNVTASIGVAEIELRDENIEDVLERADCALYDAKKAGRNCVRMASESL